jgi:hypothetical protein
MAWDGFTVFTAGVNTLDSEGCIKEAGRCDANGKRNSKKCRNLSLDDNAY